MIDISNVFFIFPFQSKEISTSCCDTEEWNQIFKTHSQSQKVHLP